MIKPPIDLALKTMTAKVSVGAHARLKELSDKLDAPMQDVLSACLLHMPEDALAKILAEQAAALDGLPKQVRAMLRNIDKLSDEERALIKGLLS